MLQISCMHYKETKYLQLMVLSIFVSVILVFDYNSDHNTSLSDRI